MMTEFGNLETTAAGAVTHLEMRKITKVLSQDQHNLG